MRLPKLIDKEMAKAINDLTPERLGDLLAAHKLSPSEILAAKARLRAVQRHVKRMVPYSGHGTANAKRLFGKPGYIVDSANWKNQDFKNLQTSRYSYAGRDYQKALDKQQAALQKGGQRPEKGGFRRGFVVPPFKQQPLNVVNDRLRQYGNGYGQY